MLHLTSRIATLRPHLPDSPSELSGKTNTNSLCKRSGASCQLVIFLDMSARVGSGTALEQTNDSLGLLKQIAIVLTKHAKVPVCQARRQSPFGFQ